MKPLGLTEDIDGVVSGGCGLWPSCWSDVLTHLRARSHDLVCIYATQKDPDEIWEPPDTFVPSRCEEFFSADFHFGQYSFGTLMYNDTCIPVVLLQDASPIGTLINRKVLSASDAQLIERSH